MSREANMTSCQRRTGDEQGFTLLELVAVVAIIGILLLIALTSYAAATSSAASATCQSNQRTLQDVVEIYPTLNGSKPTDIEDLRPYLSSFDNNRHCPLDGTALALDPVTFEVSCPNHP